MKMTRLEKRFVNRESKGEANYRRVREHLDALGVDRIDRILEIGCGIGTVAARLSRDYGARVVGTDVDPAQIELARKIYPENERLLFHALDATDLCFDDASFDLVVAQNVMHHIADWSGAIGEVARVLRPRGHFIWFDMSVSAALRKLLTPFAGRVGVYTYEQISAAMHARGLHPLTKEGSRFLLIQRHDVVARRYPGHSGASTARSCS